MTIEEAKGAIESWASSYAGEFLVGKEEHEEHDTKLEKVLAAIDKAIADAHQRGLEGLCAP